MSKNYNTCLVNKKIKFPQKNNKYFNLRYDEMKKEKSISRCSSIK